MPKTIETGKNGEEQALAFLKNAGYTILHQNWRFKHLEIDIIAQHNNELIIVEVKTRATDFFGTPESFVNKDKQRKLLKAAHGYIVTHNIDAEVRFDIVAIVTSSNKVYHIENAFYAGLG
ncbi:MAG: YraN family protein [Bacteroidia bacterium]